jgi:hypothetical protein
MDKNICEQLYELLESYHKAKDIRDDIKQYNDNYKEIKIAMDYLNGKTQYRNDREVQHCLQDTDQKYAQYIRWCNCLQGGLNFKNSRTPYVQMTYEYMVQQLIAFTNNIPAYVFLRDQKDTLLKDFFKQFLNSNVSNEQIKEVKDTIE